MNFANGTYAGWEYVPPSNHGQLINSAHIYNICYVNNTVLVYDEGYPWRTYNVSPVVLHFKRSFPWVLYANKFHNRYNV